MKRKIHNHNAARKRRIQSRLTSSRRTDSGRLVFTAQNIHYEMSERQRGMAVGGIGLFHMLARSCGLIDAIDRRLHLLKFYFPYHESDHVLNFAYSSLCEGKCLQDIEIRRNGEVFLDAIGAERIPDPTTAGVCARRCHV